MTGVPIVNAGLTNFDCPLCGQALSVAESPGSTCRCTGCSGLLRVPKTSQPRSSTTSTPTPAANIPTAEPDTTSEFDAIAEIKTTGRRGRRGGRRQVAGRRSSTRRRNQVGRFLRSNPRLFFLGLRCIFVGTPFVFMSFLAVVTLLTSDPGEQAMYALIFVISIPSFLVYWWIGRLLANHVSPHIVAMFISSVRCPGCGERISLIGVWKCSCGYHDHRQRNAYRFRCPMCKSGIGQTNCPRCEATVLI